MSKITVTIDGRGFTEKPTHCINNGKPCPFFYEYGNDGWYGKCDLNINYDFSDAPRGANNHIEPNCPILSVN